MSFPDPGQQPQYAQPAPYTHYVRPVTGAAAWALGLIALAFIPFLAATASCVAMLLGGASARKRGGIAEVNGRNAMNWALTYLIATILLVGGHFVLLFGATQNGPVSGFYPLGIPITLWAIMTLAHLVFSIVGLSRANSGKTFWAPALPLIREQRSKR